MAESFLVLDVGNDTVELQIFGGRRQEVAEQFGHPENGKIMEKIASSRAVWASGKWQNNYFSRVQWFLFMFFIGNVQLVLCSYYYYYYISGVLCFIGNIQLDLSFIIIITTLVVFYVLQVMFSQI